jgi:outer membrane biosynthesis protein TonB
MSAALRRASVTDPDFTQLAEALEPAPTHDADPSFGQYDYVEELPEVIEKVAPAYPEAARKRGVEGVVIVQALVGRDGRVDRTRLT